MSPVPAPAPVNPETASTETVDSTTLVGVGTDVQAVLEELDNGVADHLADSAGAHAASAVAFTPAGTIAATDVQAAIEEVASEAGGVTRAAVFGVLNTAASGGTFNYSGAGSQAFGFATGTGSAIQATKPGALGRGYAGSGGIIRATGYGSSAFGRATGSASVIQASAYGSFTFGYAGAGGIISASSKGGWASGYAYGAIATITASGRGSTAGGCTYGYAITASGRGAGAFGYAGSASIIASANGAFQFGSGTNALANSLGVGARATGLRLCGDGVPGTPADGDIWMESSTLKVRLGGATKTVTVV